MKLLDKFKNMFTEEVEEEVKIEPVSVKSKKEKEPVVVDSFDEVKIEKEEVKKPVFFTDSDFDDLEKKQPRRVEKEIEKPKIEYESRSNYRNSYNDHSFEKENNKEIYRGNQTTVYNDPYKEKKEERVFKPTPIISPVYGILDKNYHKEDIVSKKDVNYSVNENANTIDSIRKKAYGTLEDELENTLFGSNSILFNKKEDTDNTDDFFKDLEKESQPDLMNNNEVENEESKKIQDLEEITMDIGKELNTLLNKKDNMKKVEKEEDEDDLFNLIDTMYEGDE